MLLYTVAVSITASGASIPIYLGDKCAKDNFFWGGGNFIKSLTLSFNTQKCEFCAQTVIDNYYNLQTQKYGFGVARPMVAYFQSSNQWRFYVGAGGSAPQIQKLADRSDVISEVPKCSKIQIFRDSIPDPAEKAYSTLSYP